MAAYLAGSIPFGLILVRKFALLDLRQYGSGNIGATNARRAGGCHIGLATLFCDLLKGALPTALAAFLFGGKGDMAQAGVCLVATAAFAGHLYPVYLGFRTGGKGVATAAGCFIILSPLSLLIAFGMFGTTVALFRRVSAGSLAAAAVLPPAVYFFEKSLVPAACALFITFLIFVRHRGNIARLLSGTEPKL